jgi:hypothetical protein
MSQRPTMEALRASVLGMGGVWAFAAIRGRESVKKRR